MSCSFLNPENYSRRIGIHGREEVPILGGARLAGKVNKTKIGLLSIQTAEKDTLPSTNYSVIRVKQDILSQSNIGFIMIADRSAGLRSQVMQVVMGMSRAGIHPISQAARVKYEKIKVEVEGFPCEIIH